MFPSTFLSSYCGEFDKEKLSLQLHVNISKMSERLCYVKHFTFTYEHEPNFSLPVFLKTSKHPQVPLSIPLSSQTNHISREALYDPSYGV